MEASSSLRAGTIQVYPADVSNILRQAEREELRILAVLGESRAPGVLADLPTAREQGFDVVFTIWRGLYATPGISAAANQQWVERLGTMTRTQEWNALLAQNGLTPFYLGGSDFERFVMEQTAAYRAVSKQIGLVP